MKRLIENIIAPLAVASITAVAVLLFQFNGRLTRIEAKIERLDLSHRAPARHTLFANDYGPLTTD